MSAIHFILRWWAAFALAASLALLGIAILVFEKGLGYAPCHLCIEQREIYWAIAFVAALSLVWAFLRRPAGTPRAAAVLILAGFLVETWRATYHAGVELKWWHGPATCTGGGAMDINAIRNLLNGGPVHQPMCDVAVWTFGGLSMAGWNAVAAGILSLVSLAAVLRRSEARRAR
jgi:disulfide bond formation protein DsbB